MLTLNRPQVYFEMVEELSKYTGEEGTYELNKWTFKMNAA